MAEEKSESMANQPTDKPGSEKAKAAAEKPAQAAGKSEQRIKAEAQSPKKKVAVDETGSIWMSRRNFFSRAGWIAFFSFVGSMLIGSLRFMFPRVLFEPSPVFKAGFPDDYPVGSVSTKWVKQQRVWIVHDEQGIYAIFAQCTHLGCTPRWLDAENKFKCPCHGSGFTREGDQLRGSRPPSVGAGHDHARRRRPIADQQGSPFPGGERGMGQTRLLPCGVICAFAAK